MKRVGIFFVVIIFLCFPSSVLAASDINNYDVDVTIREDGVVDVVEHIVLSSTSSLVVRNNYLDCNGLNRLLYVGMENDLYGSDIYVPTLLTDVSAYDTSNQSINFSKKDILLGEEYYFDSVKDVYIKYSFSDLIVNHGDGSEFYYNFIRGKFDVAVKNFSVTVNLPKKSNYLKALDYQYTNNIKIVNNKTIEFKYKHSKDVNIRVVFDKDIVISSKETNDTVREFVESDINEGFINNLKYWICVILSILFCLNFIRIVILIIIKYGGNKKYNVKPNLDENLIKRYNFIGINYLINKDVTVEAFLAGILDLINSGKLNVIRGESGKFALVRGNVSSNLNVEEEYLVNFLLEVIDKKYKAEIDLITFDKLKQFCNDNSTVSSFIVNFNVWRSLQVKNAREYRFMVGNEYYFSLRNSMILSYVLLILNVLSQTYFIPGVVAFIPVTLLANIMMKLTKRSSIAEDVYKDVLSFKKGILTLAKSTKDAYRWDMFLISSISMGIGEEVEKIVKSKISDGSLVEHYNSNLIDTYRKYPDFSIVNELLPVFVSAYKKSFFIYTSRRKNNL